MKKKDVRWNQVFQDRMKESDQRIINDYKIRKYPTSFLIDPSGKIVLRISGADDFPKLEDFLKQNVK